MGREMANLKRSDNGNKTYPTQIEMCAHYDSGRSEIERYIHLTFLQAYGADVKQFMPELMSLRSDAGQLMGALGLRRASDDLLFLEQYLERPVEQLLAAKTSSPVDRDGIVEVGNLAVSGAGGGRWLITALTAYLHASHEKWVVFTAGPVLCNTFSRMGLELVELGDADPSQLKSEEREAWGSYYDQKPRVMAGLIEPGYKMLQQQLETKSALGLLWFHAGQAGRAAA
jgi:hypothetical protein